MSRIQPGAAVDLKALAMMRAQQKVQIEGNRLQIATQLFLGNFHFTIETDLSPKELSELCIKGATIHVEDIGKEIEIIESKEKENDR